MTTITPDIEAADHIDTLTAIARLHEKLDQAEPLIANRLAALAWAAEALTTGADTNPHHIDTLRRWHAALVKAAAIRPPSMRRPVLARAESIGWAIDRLDTSLDHTAEVPA